MAKQNCRPTPSRQRCQPHCPDPRRLPAAATPPEIDADVDGDEITMHLGHRRYRIRGLSKNLAFDQMKVNVLATTGGFDLSLGSHENRV